MNELSVGLIRGRHEMPVSEYVLHGPVESPNDFRHLESVCKAFLHEHVIGVPDRTVVLHVTGLGQAVTSFLKMWTWAVAHHPDRMPLLELAHHDRDSGSYLRQPWDVCLQ